MPKAAKTPTLPLNGLFPIAKPTGPSSMKVIDSITPLLLESKLFDDPVKRSFYQPQKKRKKNLTHLGLKIGQGGTLDPLADGVLVIGVNRGTKHLNKFLECSKEYESIGILGAVTTSMDSHDPILSTAPWEHVTREDIEKVLDRFRGEIEQTPPIFSALKMDGKPLYEYARESKPLPRPIPVRKCTVSIDLIDFTPASVTPGDGGHEYRWAEKRLSSEEKEVFRKLTEIVHQAGTEAKVTAAPAAVTSAPSVTAAEASADASSTENAGVEGAASVSAPASAPDAASTTPTPTPTTTAEPMVPDVDAPEYPEVSPKTGLRPPTFTVRMTVSSGTYVRSIVNDIGLALGCGAHVVKLTRTRQGEFSLYGDEAALSTSSAVETGSVTEESKDTSEEILTGPSGGSIPWSVWERALAEREAAIAQEKEEREEAILAGVDAEEIHANYSQEAIREKRLGGELKQWENEVLKRFVSVPVPLSGGHGWRE